MARSIISLSSDIRKEMVTQGDEIQLNGEQDVTEILKAAKAKRDAYGKFDKRKDTGMRHVAEIPLVVWDDMCRRCGGEPSEEMIRAWCNDPDNAMFRTSPGRL